MIVRRTAAAAVALAAAASAPWSASAAPLSKVENGLLAAERRLSDVEALAGAEESPAARALRKFSAGEVQYLLEDWGHAAVLLSEAVDEPAFRGRPQQPEALFLLADALRRQGACGAARPRYAELLSLGGPERRGDAIAGALDCAVLRRRSADVGPLLAEAETAFGPNRPPEVRYLAAKATFQRTDLAPEERARRAAAAFAEVPRPFHLQAAYFRGVLAVERGELEDALPAFGACARGEAQGSRQEDVRELCVLAVARVNAELGNVSAALDAYASLPWSSRHFPEGLYELAWTYVKGQQHGRALRIASFAAEVAPDSPVAPEATLLRGNLLLRLGRHAEAADAYGRIISTYAPVRDELDALLAAREDPVRYFNELIGRQGKTFDAATVLPPVAARWASTQGDVDVALELVGSLDAARRELQVSRELAERIERLLGQGGGLDAFPVLRHAYASAEAVQNDSAVLEGSAVAVASAAAERALPPEGRGELLRTRAARLALEVGLRALPRTQEAVDERLHRLRARLDRVDRTAFQAGYQVDALAAAVTGTEVWIEQNRAEIDSDPEGRQQLSEELRQHRDVVGAYEQQLRALRQEIAFARDAAAGAEELGEEARIRRTYLDAVDAERAAAEAARSLLSGADRDAFVRADAIHDRASALRARAEAARLGFAADAARRAAELRGRLGSERMALAAQVGSLDGLQSVAKDLVGRIAYRSFVDVRDQFYRLVLKADVGLVDVAWSRKRQRLDRIQALSQEKAAELEQLDRAYRALTHEVDGS